MKAFKTSEMGIDVNDLKVLINSGFHYLITSCRQWANDHPLVACVLIMFYILFIFFPSIFTTLFYTFPLAICVAILLEGSGIISGKQNRDIRHSKKEYYQSNGSNVTKTTTTTTSSSYSRRRPYLKSQMSRRTFGKDKNFIDDVDIKESAPRVEDKDDEDDFESFTKKYGGVEPESPIISMVETITVTSMDDLPSKCASQSMENPKSANRSDIESQDESEDDEEQKEETNKVIQWTEDDQKNLMDLGSSEIERNKRLQSLIAKRWAKKLLSMQPRRNHIDYSGEFSAFDHQHLDSVGSLMVLKTSGSSEKQPVSARLRWIPERNPFDIPYDPHEERPVLTGGSFDEEFLDRIIENKDFSSGANDGSSCGETNPFELKKDSLPSFFSNTRTNDKPGSSRFARGFDFEEVVADNEGETSLQGYNNTSHQEESTKEVRSHDQASSVLPKTESHKSEANISGQNSKHKTHLVGSTKSKKEDPETTAGQNVTQSKQVHIKEGDDDGALSSSSSSCDTNIDVTKNEAFRNSVKKVLTCLVKRKGLVGKETSDLIYDSSPIMKSYYTIKNRVTPTQSIASDMQVEVSDTGSPKSLACDPSSPIDRESLVYDGDEEREANSGDEDLWGVSPHPMKLGDSGKNRLDIETVDNNASDPRNVMRIEKEVELAPNRGEQPLSLLPISILGEDCGNDILDQKSTNGDIVQARSSSSSSSVGLDSHMQNKSVNVAEYLANLPPSESSSNVLEDPWQTHVRGTSQEEITLQDENNPPILEMDEDKDDSKERKELAASKGRSEQTSDNSQSEPPKEASLESNEQLELDNEHVKQVPNNIDNNLQFEVETTPIEKDVTETSSGLRESECNEKEVIFDSYSIHSEEDIANPTQSAEASGESEQGVTSINQVETEVKVEPPDNSVLHQEASASTDAGEANQHGTDQQEEVDTNNEDIVNLPQD